MNPTWLYVAVLFAAAVALARRGGIALPWRIAALFYGLVLVFLFRPMTGPYVNFPTDVAGLIYPWAAQAPPGLSKETVSRYEMQDVVFQMTPWAHQVRESWRSLEVPLWNGLTGIGQPLLANMQSAALSPFRLLALPLPLGYAMTAEAAMKILVALTFMFLFCRRRYDELPSAIAAIAFGFGTFVICWLHMPHASVAVFLPAVMHAVDLLAEKQTYGRLVFATVLGPLILFTGHPETTAHIVFFVALYVIWILLVAPIRSKLRVTASLAAACVVAALLSAPLLLPFMEALRGSVRYADARLHPHHDATAYSDFNTLVPLVQPSLGDRAETMSGFAGFLGVAAWFGLLARVAVRREWRSPEAFLVLATVVVFAILDDWPVSAPFRELFAMSLNARMRLVFCFLTAAMTAALVHHARSERLPLIAALLGGLATLAFVRMRVDIAVLPAIAVLAVAATRIRLAIAAALFAELWFFGHAWNVVRPASELYPKTLLIERLTRLQNAQPYRIAGLQGALFPNTQAVFGLADARVHDAVASLRYATVLAKAMPYDPLEYYPKFKDPDAAILDDLNVKWLVTDPGVDLRDRDRYAVLYDGKDGRIYENRHVKPRFMAEGARVEIVKAHNDRYDLRVDAPHETRVKASIAYWPGWRVTHNGRSLQAGMVDGAFLAFVIPPGPGVVHLRYAPRSFRGGVAAAAFGVLVLLAARLPIIRRATGSTAVAD